MIFKQFVLVTLGVLFLRDLCAYKFNWFFFSPVNLSYGNLMIRPARRTQDGWGGISPSPTLSQNCLCLSAVVDLWVYYTWNSLNFLDVNANFFFASHWRFQSWFLQLFFLLLSFPSSWDLYCVSVGILTVSHRALRLFAFFISAWIISVWLNFMVSFF